MVPWLQSMSTYSQPSFSSSTCKRGGAQMCMQTKHDISRTVEDRRYVTVECSYAASIGTTTDDLEWPWMAVSRIARYLCGSWASCFYRWRNLFSSRYFYKTGTNYDQWALFTGSFLMLTCIYLWLLIPVVTCVSPWRQFFLAVVCQIQSHCCYCCCCCPALTLLLDWCEFFPLNISHIQLISTTYWLKCYESTEYMNNLLSKHMRHTAVLMVTRMLFRPSVNVST